MHNQTNTPKDKLISGAEVDAVLSIKKSKRYKTGVTHDTLTVIEPSITVSKTKRAFALQENFKPTDAHFELADHEGVNLHSEFEKFTDYHKTHGSVFKDWEAALRTWIRNAANLGVGSEFLDTTLGFIVKYNGVHWVNPLTGAVV